MTLVTTMFAIWGKTEQHIICEERNNRIIRLHLSPLVSTQGKIGHESPNYHSAALPLSHLTEKALGRAQPHDPRFGTSMSPYSERITIHWHVAL